MKTKYFISAGCSRWTNPSKTMAIHIEKEIEYPTMYNPNIKTKSTQKLCKKKYSGGNLFIYPLTSENIKEVTCDICLKKYKNEINKNIQEIIKQEIKNINK